MEFFARLMFDRIRIGLKTVNVALEKLILMLQTVQLAVQCLSLLALGLVRCQAVLAEDYVISHCDRENRRSTGCEFPPAKLDSFGYSQQGVPGYLPAGVIAGWSGRGHNKLQYRFPGGFRQVENEGDSKAYQDRTGIARGNPARAAT